jgi:hypothetical protein
MIPPPSLTKIVERKKRASKEKTKRSLKPKKMKRVLGFSSSSLPTFLSQSLPYKGTCKGPSPHTPL